MNDCDKYKTIHTIISNFLLINFYDKTNIIRKVFQIDIKYLYLLLSSKIIELNKFSFGEVGEWLPSPRRGSAGGGKTNVLMFFVYILYSDNFDRFYIGHTKEIAQRLKDHNRGKVRSTKAYLPWRVVYTERYVTKSDAFRREMEIKSYKSGEAFKKLLQK